MRTHTQLRGDIGDKKKSEGVGLGRRKMRQTSSRWMLWARFMGSRGTPQELGEQTLAPGHQGSCVGPFAVDGPFTRLSGRRERMIFLLTTINKGIKAKSL